MDDEINGSWYQIAWRNWHEPHNDMKLNCKRRTDSPGKEFENVMTFTYVIDLDDHFPVTVVWARSNEEACDRAGKVFDKESHKIKR